jgi:hypothetical protein
VIDRGRRDVSRESLDAPFGLVSSHRRDACKSDPALARIEDAYHGDARARSIS